ncbi:DoxX family membrane protein [Dyadobacter sp. CY312]|uniref:DoxX family membrane protein n=1 Tax=Dyadobacter sp. CY312 TaxID=2907303 RepID=UPI001F41690F|nr:DoxX family membrane protein [Dyadobacter sp. CY312]MCE7040947.1 DoxX family membrane protein [Dyadobacter sp. CY312]
MTTISKFPLKEYLLLSARVLLAWTLYRYGWAKLTDGQFGVDDKTMNMALKEIDLFRLSWYLADHQPFKAFIGVSQILCAILLSLNRTAIIGAFMSIPIWLNILVWDLTFMGNMAVAFTFRLSYYLILTGLIIYQQKDKLIPAVILTTQVQQTVKFPIWAYMALPVTAIGIEIAGALPNAVLNYFR